MAKRGKNNTPPPGMQFEMEKALRHSTDHVPGDTRARARDLALDAMAAESTPEQLELAIKAVVLDPRCTDALVILADVFDETGDYIDALRLIVERAAEDLGPELFKQEREHFWSLMETRPYMRARFQLAMTLTGEESLDEAITEFEAMLDLNPTDNQGCRFFLLGLYFETNQAEKAASLLTRYADETSAPFAWSRVLLELLNDNPAAAEEELQKAREANKHVEPYLTGRKRIPAAIPEYYSLGDTDEAIVCAGEIGASWEAHPEAVAWLKQHEAPREKKARK